MTDPPTTESARILIVDDEPLNVDLLSQELEDSSYVTDIAYGGREALDKVATDPPDLILLDVMMPDIDGITVCRMLKEDPTTRLIPIVIMTALNATEDRIRGIEAGADDFLSKPVDNRELLARINTALKTKRVVDKTVEELRSASAQLDRMGAHEEDLSVLVIELDAGSHEEGDTPTEARGFMLARYRSAYAAVLTMFSGEVSKSEENQVIAVIRSADSESHPRLAVEAALAVQAETEALNRNNTIVPVIATIGIASGKASIGSVRIEHKNRATWVFSVEGPALGLASQLAKDSARGEIAISDETIARTDDRFAVEIGDGSLRVVADGSEIAHGEAEPVEKDSVADDQSAPTRRGSLPWPAEYDDLESEIHSNWGIEELYFNRVLSGKSGALVYTVDITAREFSGQAILKLSELDDPTMGEENEASRHQDAVAANPTYAERHLPKVVATLEVERNMAVLITIAARGLEYSMPWAHCAYNIQFDSARQLSNGLLEDWNASYVFAKGIINPAELLASWLSYRLDPAQGGRIHDLFNECDIDPEAASFFFDGHWYPNPLAFALNAVGLPDHLVLRAAVGNMHGDLHGYNVLVEAETDQVKYHIIDLAFYQPDAFLLFDHAYFEISHLLQQRGNASLRDWLAVVDSLERSSSPRGDDVGLIQLLRVVREEVLAWVDRHEPNRLSYLESQFMLARVAAGLNFGHKRIPLNARVRGLLYAAACLKSYLKFHMAEWPKNGDVLQFDERPR